MVNTLEGIGSQTHCKLQKNRDNCQRANKLFISSFLTLMMIFAEFLDLVENHSGIFTWLNYKTSSALQSLLMAYTNTTSSLEPNKTVGCIYRFHTSDTKSDFFTQKRHSNDSYFKSKVMKIAHWLVHGSMTCGPSQLLRCLPDCVPHV